MHTIPLKQQLVLVGGGHANVQVITAFAMRPLRDVSVVLISDQVMAGYSGMLPGWIAGQFTRAETHIDLARLCSVAGVVFIHDRVTDIDVEKKLIHCRDHPSIIYDVLSLNTGSVPKGLTVSGESSCLLSVKPVEPFLQNLDSALKKLPQGITISVIGGGVAGIEVILSVMQRLRLRDDINYQLLTRSDELVPTLNRRARVFLERWLADKQVRIRTNFSLSKLDSKVLISANNEKINSDITILCTGGKPSKWLEGLKLEKDKSGFIAISSALESLSHHNVFAAGDVASLASHNLEKSGVFAVRQGKVLAINLRNALCGRKLKIYRPQQSFLKLISLGEKKALAVRGPLAAPGSWVWQWKHRIDRKFVNQFNHFSMISALTQETAKPIDASMRCSGCAAKVNQAVLIGSLQQPNGQSVAIDDASVMTPPADQQLIQSVDFFPALVDDVFVNTRITLNHALNDCYAMGVMPHSVLNMIGLPAAENHIQKNRLEHIHTAIREGLKESGAYVLGGHTAETSQLTTGFCVNAYSPPEALWRKQGMQDGDLLILTKPLGSGVIFAAHAQGKCPGEVVSNCIEQLLQSNQAAVAVLRQFEVHACTDVTGFGVVGHLSEMLVGGSKVTLKSDQIPAYDGAISLLGKGIRSSLHSDNKESSGPLLQHSEALGGEVTTELLFDPQTAGGLLAAVASNDAQNAVQQLSQKGYQASIIGEVSQSEADSKVFLE